VVGLLNVERPRTLGLALGLTILGCGPKESGADATEGVETTTNDASTSEGPGTSSTMDASSDSADADGVTSTGSHDPCPPADDEVRSARINFVAPSWPDDGPTAIDALCEAESFASGTGVLNLRCAHPTLGTEHAVEIHIGDTGIGDRIADWVGASGLAVSFFQRDEGDPWGTAYWTASLRDGDGALLLLAHHSALLAETPAAADGIEVGRPGWLDPGSPEWEAWSAPLPTMTMRDMGCPERPPLRGGSRAEVPLALELAVEAGTVSIFDRNQTTGIQVAGGSFDVIVSDAFVGQDVTCVDCAGAAITFLVLAGPS
jgi:hypothetical protein